jgi:hypothetical protein
MNFFSGILHSSTKKTSTLCCSSRAWNARRTGNVHMFQHARIPYKQRLASHSLENRMNQWRSVLLICVCGLQQSISLSVAACRVVLLIGYSHSFALVHFGGFCQAEKDWLEAIHGYAVKLMLRQWATKMSSCMAKTSMLKPWVTTKMSSCTGMMLTLRQ